MKLWLKVDNTADDALIEALVSAAEEYVSHQINTSHDDLTPTRQALFQAAVKMLVTHWYESRTAVVTGTIATELPFAVQSILGILSNFTTYL